MAITSKSEESPLPYPNTRGDKPKMINEIANFIRINVLYSSPPMETTRRDVNIYDRNLWLRGLHLIKVEGSTGSVIFSTDISRYYCVRSRNYC
ncbi:hypothetical protein NPIL_695391 [Nephila pilipes]|uniref:Uncharacterized protein n=1 Tax=Nephila pilipes TaxID=299642 RepID=A0A8X6PI49_NEPPI|nr:hypothetical protein NPIL_695391 [Nephila pilipes]